MIVSMIVAASERGVIGKDGGMPWKLPADMRRFRALTMGHSVIMGRKTFDTLGDKGLPGRHVIVLTRGLLSGDTTAVASLADALREAQHDDEIFIAGGAEIYNLALHLVDRIYLTRVYGDIDGDTVVPCLDGGVPTGFDETSAFEWLDDPRNTHRATFHTYDKKVSS